MPKNVIELARISVQGVVQGVGFRPFIYQLAAKYGFTGWVCNTSADVRIEVEGKRKHLERFIHELQRYAPPMSRIKSINISYQPVHGYTSFEIRHSIKDQDRYQLISSDITSCSLCKDEIFNPADRRYRYPFTNCTNCGPRFTIIKDIPYDRTLTTMADFVMCPDCQQEYDNPLNRRFHAQPNACPNCGPVLTLLNAKGKPVKIKDVINTTCRYLQKGKVIAIKGLGGFLLACDATNDNAVNLLRARKKRPHKPLAIMVTDIKEARRYCTVLETEKIVLKSPPSPIVLLPAKKKSKISAAVAPNQHYLGIMLPYTPLHHILLTEYKKPLVMTSGNISEEPIARENEEAVQRLAGIADFFLVHNRYIHSTYDDSVTSVINNQVQMVRRARGYAPYPVHLPYSSKQILACGSEEKNTFCLTKDTYAFISQHIGDMENIETLEYFQNTVNLYKKLFRIEPEIIAYDMHPEYLTTKYALEQKKKHRQYKAVPVQHHHAHIVSCMVDNNIELPVIGVALDGTGYGSEGKLWGGEFMVADYRQFERVAHLEYLPLPGGAAAIKQPYRTAISYLYTLLGKDAFKLKLDFLKNINSDEIEFIKRQAHLGFNTPLTSSMGRLFDAVSSLIGIRNVITYEAQAAIELEMAAYPENSTTESYHFTIIEHQGTYQIKIKDLLAAIVTDLSQGISRNTISSKFHNSIAHMVNKICSIIRQKTKIEQIALSGGVFQNRLLLSKVSLLLQADGFSVLTHRQVPCNDGGISLGQAAIANFSEK